MKKRPKREVIRRVEVPSKAPARIPYLRVAVLLALLLGLMLLAKSALADGDDHNRHDHQTAGTQIFKDDKFAEGLGWGILLTCSVRLVYTLVEERRWTWCGEDRSPDTVPNFGPAVKAAPTDDQTTLRIYQ